MITVQETAAGSFKRVGGNPTLANAHGVRASLRTILNPSWSDEERAAFGVHRVEPAPVPEGQRATAERFERQDGRVVQVRELEPAPPPRRSVAKLTVIDRLSDPELARLRTALRTSDRHVERWQALQAIDSADGQIVQAFVSLFGTARADELLAPE